MTRIGVLIEAHYEKTELHLLNEVLTKGEFELEYLSYLSGQDTLALTQAKDIVIDSGLISGEHPAVAELLVDTLKSYLLNGREGD